MEISSLGNVLETAREFTLEAASTAAQFIEGMGADSDITRLLASTNVRDQITGLKMVLADVSRGNPPTQHFASVVKCASSNDACVRRMVYQFVVMYGAVDPNLALMTVNAVQKTLLDKNPVTRCLALKTISAMPIANVAPIVAMNVRTMSTDNSHIVRQTVARAIGKCHSLDPALGSDLLVILEKLLNDKTPAVQGTAVEVLANSFPNRFDLLHKPFRSICANLRAFELVTIAPSLRLLLRYARHFMDASYSDTKLLLESLLPLFQCPQSDIIITAASLFHYLADSIPDVAASAVCALAQTQLVLENSIVFVKHHPAAFKPYIKRFYIVPSDTDNEMVLKLRILSQLADDKNLKTIIRHLQFYAKAYQSPSTIAAVFQTISACATRAQAVPKIIRWLIHLVSKGDPSPLLVSHALLSLRVLMQQVATNGDTLQHIASLLSQEGLPCEAKATIYWLIGEASGTHKALACEVLRTSIKSMASMETPVRLQIIQLAAKLYSHYLDDSADYDERVPKFFTHVAYLGKYDPDYDTRDRCRMFTALLTDQNHELATLLLQAQKLPPSMDVEQGDEYLIGSSALTAGRPLVYYTSLEDWGKKDPTLRDVDDPLPTNPVYAEVKQISHDSAKSLPLAQKNRKVLSLEEFLEPTDDSSSSEESEESETESENSESHSTE